MTHLFRVIAWSVAFVAPLAPIVTAASPVMVRGADVTMPARFSAYEELAAFAESIGGRTEIAAEDGLQLRIPRGRLDEAFDRMRSAGGSVWPRSTDVSTRLDELGWRLRVLRAARARMIAPATGPPDAHAVGRLEAEITTVEGSIAALTALVDYPRVSVGPAAAINGATPERQAIPSEWVARLAPFGGTAVGSAHAPIFVALPEDFVVYARDRRWHAEHDSGIQIRVGGLEEPEGDVDYWQGVVVRNLAPLYGWYSEVDAGAFGVTMIFNTSDGFIYVVGVATAGSDLIVAEAVVPVGDDTERHLDLVETILNGTYP